MSLNICISPHKHPWHHPCYASSVSGSFIGGKFLGDSQSETVLPWDWQTDITGLGSIINCEDCEMWVCDSSHNLMLTCVDIWTSTYQLSMLTFKKIPLTPQYVPHFAWHNVQEKSSVIYNNAYGPFQTVASIWGKSLKKLTISCW